MKLAMTYSYLKQDLNKIEDELNQTIEAEHPILREASQELLRAGGKRLRPIFALLSAKFGSYDFNRIKRVAVSLELIHMASLVHDDVIDESELRRGKPTVKAQWDNRIAMYTGDYIFARSIEYLTTLEDPRVHRILSDTIIELSIGEIEQIKDKYNLDQNLRNYLRRIERKTALLISSSCQIGAIASDASELVVDALFRYGYYIGMSYQIIDDILDFTSTEVQLGKPAGGDLLQGNLTLPVLYALEDPVLYKQLSQLFEHPENITIEQVKPFINRIKRSDAIDRSYQLSERFLDKAFASLEKLPNIKEKSTLRDIATYIGKRKS